MTTPPPDAAPLILEFGLDEIRLWRCGAGATPLAAAAVDAPDFPERIAAMRAAAAPADAPPPAADLRLPPEHVLTTRIMGLGAGAEARRAAAEAAIADRKSVV